MSIAAIKMSANERRNHPKVWEALAAQYPIVEMPDDCGDFHIATDDGNLLIIERKSPSDLVGSIRSGRLFAQATKYKAETKWVYFVITGTISYSTNGKAVMYRPGSNWTETGWDFAAVEGALATLQQMGCVVMRCAGESDFTACVVRIGNRNHDHVIVPPLREAIVLGPFNETPNGTTITEQQRIGAGMLTVLPGIGPHKALSVMEHFPTVGYAFDWLTHPGEFEPRIKGIGVNTKLGIQQIIGGRLVLDLSEGILNGGNND